MTDRIEFTPDYGAKENSSIIKVIGVGGGGSNAVKHMFSEGIVGVDFLVCNTDKGHLDKSPIPDKLLLGPGLGAGADPEVARQYAIESKDKLREFIGENTKMLFITAGMGKGTGTGASPVIAEIAKEMGILTIGVVTYPFNFESKKRHTVAQKGIDDLNKYVDSLIVVKNQNILTFYKDQSIMKAYGYADDVLKNAVKCIAELITVDYGQNVDFNDVQTIMKDSGKAMLGIATASGEDRVNRVVDDALNCPLLDTTVINDAQNFLFFISYGPDSNLLASELDELTKRFETLQSEDADIIWGQGLDESLGDAIKLSVIITNFSSDSELTKTTTTWIEDKNNTGEIIVTEQKIGERIVEQPVTSPSASAPGISTIPNDIAALTTSVNHVAAAPNFETNPVNSNPKIFDIEGENVTARATSTQTLEQRYTPSQHLEEQVNPLYKNEDEWRNLTEVPAIFRMNQERAATVTANSMTATMEMHPHLQVANDMSEFFTDLAD